jgi:hypothetical protein
VPVVAVVDLLVARGADIDDDVGDGHTPLIDACFRKDSSAACHLIDRGAKVNVEFRATSPRVSKDMDYAYFTGRGVRPIGMSNPCRLFPVRVVFIAWGSLLSCYAPGTAALLLNYLDTPDEETSD